MLPGKAKVTGGTVAETFDDFVFGNIRAPGQQRRGKDVDKTVLPGPGLLGVIAQRVMQSRGKFYGYIVAAAGADCLGYFFRSWGGLVL